MNRALWPASLGYTLETMLHPVLGATQVDATRWFYTHFVAGRGFLPGLRVGDQPYGVLPVGALSQWALATGDPAPVVGGIETPEGVNAFLPGLQTVLATMRGDWATLAQAVSFVGKPGDAHQLLLDVIGLHPASVEFHQRYAESLHHIFNRAKFQGLGAQLLQSIQVLGLQDPAMELLRRLGYQGEVEPDALQRFFFTQGQRLNGPVIDDRPLSESDPIRAYTTDDRNYLEWLADSARQSFEDLRLERGFKDDRAPDALLYVMLRHALLLGYWDSGLRLHLARGAMEPAAVSLARREPAAIHVQQAHDVSESRFVPLYSRDVRVTGDPNLTVVERVGQLIGADRAASALADQLSALDLLKDTPTARLERCLAEHVDTASYRLDAWLLGLVHLKLAAMRYRERRDPTGADGDPPIETRLGIHLGAYGWLEDLQRKAPLPPVQLSEDLGTIFGSGAPAAARSGQRGLRARAVDHPGDHGRDPARRLSRQRVARGARGAGREPVVLARAHRARPDRRHTQRPAPGRAAGLSTPTRTSREPCASRARPLHPRAASAVPARGQPAGLDPGCVGGRRDDRGQQRRRRAEAPRARAPAGQRARIRSTCRCRERPRRKRLRSTRRWSGCGTRTMRSPTWPSPRACTSRCSATTIVRPRRWMPTPGARFRRSPKSIRTPRSGIALTHRVGIHFEAGATLAGGGLQSARARTRRPW